MRDRYILYWIEMIRRLYSMPSESTSNSVDPSSTPTRLSLFFALFLIVYALYFSVRVENFSALWFAIGLVTGYLAMGPIASSRFGRRIGKWVRRIGVRGRLAAVRKYAILVVALNWFVDIPADLVTCFFVGSLASIGLYTIGEYIREH